MVFEVSVFSGQVPGGSIYSGNPKRYQDNKLIKIIQWIFHVLDIYPPIIIMISKIKLHKGECHADI